MAQAKLQQMVDMHLELMTKQQEAANKQLELLEAATKAALDATTELGEKNVELALLRRSVAELTTKNFAAAARIDLRGTVEGFVKTMQQHDADIMAAVGTKKLGVQELLKLIYNKKPDLRQYLKDVCKIKNLDEDVIVKMMTERIWHDLSKGVHGATTTPRAIYEHGDRGWEANEAATLSIFLDHFELDYTFFSNNYVVEPPPYRL